MLRRIKLKAQYGEWIGAHVRGGGVRIQISDLHQVKYVNKRRSIRRKRRMKEHNYTRDFNRHFKQGILIRDNYICVICDNPGRTVHHIDYDKENTIWGNCITLCSSCHSATNSNRKYWRKRFAKIIDSWNKGSE